MPEEGTYMIIFTHIPRTSGKYIERHVIPSKLKSIYKFHKKLMYIGKEGSYPVNKNIQVITGHIPYGIHEYLRVDCSSFDYIVFLRNPIERWISEFNHSIRYPSFVKPIWKRSSSPRDFLRRCKKQERNTNIMTKQLSGMERFTDVIQDHKNYMFMWARRKKRYSEDDMQNMLNVAKENLSKYRFVGFPGESYYKRLCKIFNWKYKKCRRMNRSSSNPMVNWKSKKYIDYIMDINKYDMALYNFAIEKFKL